MTYRCSDCGLDFYGEGPRGGVADEVTANDPIIDDKEVLHEAEQEIQRQIEEDDDRRCR